MGEGIRVSLWLRSYWQLMAIGEGEIGLPQDVVPGGLLMFPQVANTSKCSDSAKWLNGFKENINSRGECGGRGKGLW